MSMATTLRLLTPVTDEELLELSKLNPGYQIERDAAGELIMAPTGGKSGRREVRLLAQLDQWAEREGTGVAFGPSTGFRLPDSAVRAPDASWVRRSRWNALSPAEQDRFAPICPDAVFEIASPSTRVDELEDKMRAYLANGARLGILIDPEERAVEIYRPGRDPILHRTATEVALDPELPGFVLKLEPISTA
jgi:Uma2 family endonuclease